MTTTTVDHGTAFVEVCGHTFVGPTLGKDRELTRPYPDYFRAFIVAFKPELDSLTDEECVVWWASKDEQTRKDCVRAFFKEQSVFHGDDSRTVHEIRTKGANDVRALVPWNQPLPTDEEHNALHMGMLQIYHFDPLDTENGLIVFDHTRGGGSHLVPKDDLWFYRRPDPTMAAEVDRRRKRIEAWVLRRRVEAWEAAEDFAWLKEHDAHLSAGEPSFSSLVCGMGVPSDEASRYAKAYELAERFGALTLPWRDDERDEMVEMPVGAFVDPDTAVKPLKAAEKGEKLAPEDVREELVHVSGLGIADRMEHLKRFNTRGGNKRKRLEVNYGDRKIYTCEIEDGEEPDPKADVVVEGSKFTIVRGQASE